MNAPLSHSAVLSSADWMAALVRRALVHFARDVLAEGDPLIAAIGAEADSRAALPVKDWSDWSGGFASAWQLAHSPLLRLADELGLQPPGLFVLGLAGACEESHLVTLLIDRLQAPEGGARPRAHLALAIAGELFGPAGLDVHWLQSLGLVSQGVLRIDGDGPLPLRVLRIEPLLWSVLNGHPVLWPDCAPVALGRGEGADAQSDEVQQDGLLPEAVATEVPRLAGLLSRGHVHGLVIRGTPGCGRALLAGEIAKAAGMLPVEVPFERWRDDPALPIACRYGGWLPLLRPRLGPGELWEPPAPVAQVSTAYLLGADGAVAGAGLLEIQLPVASLAQRRRLWLRHLGGGSAGQPDGQCIEPAGADSADAILAETASSALLGGPLIATLAKRTRMLAERDRVAPAPRHLAEARALLGAERLRLLAQPVERRVSDDALVLPPTVLDELRAAIARGRQREQVLAGLGATLAASPSLGLRLLLVGESGTGKTLIASYFATALGAPLYRVDLAAVMNKYIGESEKNLGALLDQAAAHDVLLLFDEADSLFGRRTERKETGERYANMLTNFLLTRIENHPGIVVLTTNSRERIDTAFTRRLDQIIEVPLPGFEERLGLWRSHLGSRGPEDALCRQLAGYCGLAGGQIRNVVLTASALAGDAPIGQRELLAALRGEYRKIGRGLPTQVERMAEGIRVVPDAATTAAAADQGLPARLPDGSG